jgi:4-hydroxy-2-oxoheptanedioate aldolase
MGQEVPMGKLREKLTASGALLGAFQSLPSPVAGEAMGLAGADFVVADIQHGALDWSVLLSVLYGIQAGGAAPLVRIARCDPAEVMRALDIGAEGVVVPMVSTPAEASAIASAARYGPVGTRSIGPVRGPLYTVIEGTDRPFVMAMIETVEGMDNLDAIAATDGIDGLLLGPGDLALSMGLPLSAEPPARIVEATQRIVEACDRHGLVAGTVSLSPEAARHFAATGMRMIALGSDVHFIGARLRDLLGAVKASDAGQSLAGSTRQPSRIGTASGDRA